jgi:NAD(P)-dependent dehydrogenase (short-subunit alcohol dehydrogenase family)
VSRRVLVTGAASGLGKAMAERFTAAGDRVLYTDLVAPAAEHALPLDVTDDAAWANARAWVEERWGGLDILVNNAGVAGAGRIETVPMEDWHWIIETNLLSAVRGCRTFVPLLKAQRSGHVVNVASLAGLLTPPTMGSYNVSKAGVVALSDTLRAELAPFGVRTTLVCPGFVRTNLAASARSSDPALADLTTKLVTKSELSAEEVAVKVISAVDRGTYLVLTEPVGRLAWIAKRYAPALVHGRTVAAAHRLHRRIEGRA